VKLVAKEKRTWMGLIWLIFLCGFCVACLCNSSWNKKKFIYYISVEALFLLCATLWHRSIILCETLWYTMVWRG